MIVWIKPYQQGLSQKEVRQMHHSWMSKAAKPGRPQLGLTGKLTCLRVTTYGGNEKKVKAVKVKFTLFSRDQSVKFVVSGYSLDELQIVSNPSIDETTRQSWTHLNGLNFPHVGVEESRC